MTTIITIQDTHRGALYEDGVFTAILGPGRHDLRSIRPRAARARRNVALVDIRDRTLALPGQDYRTADQVAVRATIHVDFRVTDIDAALHRVDSYAERLEDDVQGAARRRLAATTIDALLNDRGTVATALRADAHALAAAYGIAITRAGVDDLVLPAGDRHAGDQDPDGTPLPAAA
jgi:regulator of protease activity HflC (stomatin/prohibitin superfamily)